MIRQIHAVTRYVLGMLLGYGELVLGPVNIAETKPAGSVPVQADNNKP